MLYQICHEAFEHSSSYYFKTETTITNDTCTNQSIGFFDISPRSIVALSKSAICFNCLSTLTLLLQVVRTVCVADNYPLTEEIFNSFDKVIPKTEMVSRNDKVKAFINRNCILQFQKNISGK